MAKTTCSAAGCDRPAQRREWCKAHYARWLRNGDVGTTPLGVPALTAEQRFWRLIDKSGECWLYTGTLNRHGYAQFTTPDGAQPVAHRVAYELLVGPIPEGLVLDHLCRVRHCVRPDHLEPVTQAENVRRGVAARPAQTHCKRGHELAADNLYWNQGQRWCRKCMKIRRAKTQAKKVAAR